MTTVATFYRADYSTITRRVDGRFGQSRLIDYCLSMQRWSRGTSNHFTGFEVSKNGRTLVASFGLGEAKQKHTMHALLTNAGYFDIQFDISASVAMFVDCIGLTRQAHFENITEESINGPLAWNEVVDLETDVEAEKRDYTNREYRRLISHAHAKADKEIPSIAEAVSRRIRVFTDSDSFRLNSMSVY